MTAYYNENEPYCVEWLRNLIEERLIAPGDVDSRDIRDVVPNDLRDYTQCHFFAGLGGWSRALRLADWPDHRPVWTGSCPCQPFSAAGKRAGFADERHLWPYWQYLIAQCRPSAILGEQVARAADWLNLVRGDLEALDYTVGCMPVEAASTGADHLRDRYWIVADRECSAGDRRTDFEIGRTEGRTSADGTGGFVGSRVVAYGTGFAEREPQYPNGAEPRQWARSDSGGTGGVDLVDACGTRLALGSLAEVERGDIRDQGPPAGEAGDRSRRLQNPAVSVGDDERAVESGLQGGYSNTSGWVLGADGKARRVKPGIRLLAHAVPARVAKLRAFGNAIDPKCAAEFIKAYKEIRCSRSK